MMFAVVYLSSKLGQVAGKGLFDVIRDHYPKWILNVSLIGEVDVLKTFTHEASVKMFVEMGFKEGTSMGYNQLDELLDSE